MSQHTCETTLASLEERQSQSWVRIPLACIIWKRLVSNTSGPLEMRCLSIMSTTGTWSWNRIGSTTSTLVPRMEMLGVRCPTRDGQSKRTCLQLLAVLFSGSNSTMSAPIAKIGLRAAACIGKHTSNAAEMEFRTVQNQSRTMVGQRALTPWQRMTTSMAVVKGGGLPLAVTMLCLTQTWVFIWTLMSMLMDTLEIAQVWRTLKRTMS
mmetsp:Transcript_64274/g.121731  ORF Transcript_64274/g.121731 Transcript_64274/m.121731 type:complete len:208 (+) Transcript_64274:798-1421(+)